MVVLSNPSIIPRLSIGHDDVPVVDLWKPGSGTHVVRACEELGVFKLTNQGAPIEVMKELETEALKFFSWPQNEKAKGSPPNPFGYGDKKIGSNGDVGWVEYLLFTTNTNHLDYHKIASSYGDAANTLIRLVEEYVKYMKKVGHQVLEKVAEGLEIHPKNALSKFVIDEQSDSFFRLNHFPPCPDFDESNGTDLIGFGEHTDPQIISILRSNDTYGFQILHKNGNWVSIPPDRNSLFVLVGDSLQVMTNGRFKSVKHRVVANRSKSRVSMIYFGGPPLSEKIAPLPSLMMKEEDNLYKEFTWLDYKKSAFHTRLGDNRLALFHKITTST